MHSTAVTFYILIIKLWQKKNREPYEQFPHDVTINRFIPFDIVIIV